MRKSLLSLILPIIFIFGSFLFSTKANAEVKTEKFYSSYDGRILSQLKTTWQETKNVMSGRIIYKIEEYQNAPNSNFVDYQGIYEITRRIDILDTENIPNNAKIKSARFYFYPINIYNYDDSGIVLVKTFQNSTSSLELSDFTKFQFIAGAEMKFSDMIMNQYNFLEFNTEALTWIEKEGWTKLGLVTTHDFYNIEPTFSNSLISTFSEYPGTDKDPYLEITYEIPDEVVKNPLVIVPGILASYLNKDETGHPEVWPNLPKMIISPWDKYLDYLKMDINGNSINPVVSKDVIRSIAGKDLFVGLLEELENSGYVENDNLYVFPYDWRYNIDVTSGVEETEGVVSLADRIEQVLLRTGAEKVDIIAHSMGGLLVKNYLNHFGSSTVGKFIDIATPHLGAPKAFKMLQYGDDMGFSAFGMGLNQKRSKKITQFMPSVYQLLPSEKYFDYDDNLFGYFYTTSKKNVVKLYDYSSTMNYLANNGGNSVMIRSNRQLHRSIDDYSFDNAYNIVGCRIPTIGKIGIFKGKKKRYILRYKDGDGTVPLESAMDFKEPVIFSHSAVHSDLPAQNGVKQFISAVLKNATSTFEIGNFQGLSTDDSQCGISGYQVSVHSPIDLHAYDSEGKHTGPNETFGYDREITGSQYDRFEDDKFLFLSHGDDYVVEGSSTGSGLFSLRMDKVVNGSYEREMYFHEIEIGLNSKFYFNITDEVIDGYINLDFDGDGVYEKKIYPSTVLIGEEIEDFVAPTTKALINGTVLSNTTYVDDVEITLAANDNDEGAGILKTEYSLDGENWLVYDSSLKFSEVGDYKIRYFSTDRAGNSENVHETSFSINKYGDIDGLIEYVNQRYEDGLINKKLVRHNLVQKLERLKKSIEWHNSREEKVSGYFHRKNSKSCLWNKSKKYVYFFSNFNKKISSFEDKLVQSQIDRIIKDLEHYNKKKWIEPTVYEYINGYTRYLKKEL